jgi:hypothetical protein
MTRKAKILGLLLIVLVAIAAVSATGVWAEEEEEQGTPKRFTFESAPAFVTGEQGKEKTVLTAEGELEVACDAHYEGTASATTVKELEVTPKYTGCTAEPLGLATDVNFEGCKYLFTLEAGLYNTAGGSTHTKGPFHIVCPTGKSVSIKVTLFGSTFCKITVLAQTPTVNVIDQKNEDPKNKNERDVLFTSTVSGISYLVEGGAGNCGDTSVGHLNGALDGSVTMKAYKDDKGTKTNEQIGFRISGTAAP